MKYLLIIFLAINLQAQSKYTAYKNYIDEKEYDIDVSYYKDGYTIVIYARPLDITVKSAYIKLTKKDHLKLMPILQNVRTKLFDWSKVAYENKVLDLQKPMDIEVEFDYGFYYDDKWHEDNNVKFSPIFKVVDFLGIPKPLLFIQSPKLTSPKYRTLTFDGINMTFDGILDFDSFLDKISIENIEKFRTAQKTEDLFKN